MPNPPKHRPSPDFPLHSQPPTTTPANDNRIATPPALGSWQRDRFTFESAAARDAWYRRAYAQGVHPENWQHGTPVDARTEDAIKAGIAGPIPPYYRAPNPPHCRPMQQPSSAAWNGHNRRSPTSSPRWRRQTREAWQIKCP